MISNRSNGTLSVPIDTSKYVMTQEPKDCGFFLFKRLDRRAITNFPQKVKLHSNGFEWGYLGSGPADTALNILEYVINIEWPDDERRYEGSAQECYTQAELLHQEFKVQFIARMNYYGGQLAYDDVKKWLVEKRRWMR